METLDRDTVTMETLDCDTVTMETLDCDTVTMETLDHDTVTMKTLDRDTVTMETLDRDTVTMETLDRDTVTMETLDHDTVRMETIYNENNCTATMEALDSKSSLSVKMDSLDTEKTGESNHTVTMQTLICESNCTVTMDTGINESNPTVTPETHNIDSSSAATVDSLNTQGDKINHTVTVKTFGKENNCTVTTETSGTLFSECSHAVPSESTETVTTDSINSANDVKEMADDEPVHKKARLVTAEPERECSRILPKAQDKTECCCVIIPAGGENYSSGTSENVTVEESCEAAASRQDRNIENAESRQDRNIENAESRQDRNIENAESRQDRNIENAESRQDRNIENAESRQDRNIENAESRQDRNIENAESRQDRNIENAESRQDRNIENAESRQDRNIENAESRQDRNIENAESRQDRNIENAESRQDRNIENAESRQDRNIENAESRQDRNIENAESRQDRNIENAESRQDRNIENAESRQDRNIENAESRQDRNIENAESRQDRNIEHTKSRQDKGSEDGASKQNKDEEDNLNRQDKDSEDAINRQDKDSEDAINRQDKDSEDAINRPDKDSSAETQLPLTEIQAGITEYLGVHEGFSAIIKQRYSDFIVNEIDVQDNVVHLTHLEPPEDDDVETAMNCEEAGEVAVDVISEEDKAKIESLVKSGDRKEVINIVAPPDKQSRTNIHLAVKKRYTQLETRTAEVDGQKFIQVMWKTGRSRDKNPNDWPASKKEFKYVKFVLYKENKDTMDAIGLIAKNLKLKESLFQYAGSKDKRAKSSQEVTAQRIHPKKLAFMNKVLWNIGLGNFEYVKEPLKLGQLSGNQFTIVLRNSQGRTEIVDKAMSSLKTVGFINYFGMQRFGTTSVPTHRVGCSLLLGDWEKAVDLILMPRNDGQSKDTFQKVWMETRDPEATLRVTPRYCGLERNLLEALKRKMKPFNALEKISRNTRLLYIHSYQALVWNQMTSKRLKVLGQKPVVGDLVFPGGSESSENCSPTVITQDNIDQFSLNQVILPLPGHSVVYPDNEVYEWYRQTLASDGLDIDNMKKQQKDYSLPGAYRHIVARPSSVSWSHHRYDDYSLPLTLSDMDVIKGNTLPASQNKGKFKAVILKMTLPSSCYATMALREVMRVDTSAAHQSSMNVS